MIESRPNFSAGPGAEAPIPLAEPETIPAGFPVIPPEVVRGNDTYIELRKLEDKVAAGETLTVQEACDIQDIVAVELGKHVVNRGKDNERTFYYLPNAGLNEKTGKGVAKTFAASRVDALLRVANPVVDAAGKEPAREIPIAAAKPAPKAPSAFEIALDAVQRVNTARTASAPAPTVPPTQPQAPKQAPAPTPVPAPVPEAHPAAPEPPKAPATESAPQPTPAPAPQPEAQLTLPPVDFEAAYSDAVAIVTRGGALTPEQFNVLTDLRQQPDTPPQLADSISDLMHSSVANTARIEAQPATPQRNPEQAYVDAVAIVTAGGSLEPTHYQYLAQLRQHPAVNPEASEAIGTLLSHSIANYLGHPVSNVESDREHGVVMPAGVGEVGSPADGKTTEEVVTPAPTPTPAPAATSPNNANTANADPEITQPVDAEVVAGIDAMLHADAAAQEAKLREGALLAQADTIFRKGAFLNDPEGQRQQKEMIIGALGDEDLMNTLVKWASYYEPKGRAVHNLTPQMERFTRDLVLARGRYMHELERVDAKELLNMWEAGKLPAIKRGDEAGKIAFDFAIYSKLQELPNTASNNDLLSKSARLFKTRDAKARLRGLIAQRREDPHEMEVSTSTPRKRPLAARLALGAAKIATIPVPFGKGIRSAIKNYETSTPNYNGKSASALMSIYRKGKHHQMQANERAAYETALLQNLTRNQFRPGHMDRKTFSLNYGENKQGEFVPLDILTSAGVQMYNRRRSGFAEADQISSLTPDQVRRLVATGSNPRYPEGRAALQTRQSDIAREERQIRRQQRRAAGQPQQPVYPPTQQGPAQPVRQFGPPQQGQQPGLNQRPTPRRSPPRR